jgi:hypothetical protein
MKTRIELTMPDEVCVNIYEEMKTLTLSEIGELCSVLSRHILSYFKDVLLDKNPVNQSLISRHLVVIQRHMGILGNLWIEPRRLMLPSINIKHIFIIFLKDNGESRDMTIKMLKDHFQITGPKALINVLQTVYYKAIERFSSFYNTLEDMTQVQRCLKQVDAVIRSLKKIISQISDDRIYEILETTYLGHMKLCLDITYNHNISR